MKQILFPTTYTSLSKVAYRYAQKLAQYFETGITVAHVYPNVKTLAEGASKTAMEDLAEKQWNDQLGKAKDFTNEMSAKQFGDIPLDYVVTDGDPAEELLDVQQQNDFDLVVMGMRRHSIGDKLFGNTTYKLIDQMKCPLLLVPPNTYYMGIKKIIYGTAFNLGDKEAIEYLLEWCLAFNAKLHLLHVHKQDNKALATRKMEMLISDFREEHKGGIITTQLLEGKIKPVMEQYVDIGDTDILAVHHRKEGFWQRIKEGSLTKVLAEGSEIPLLVLKSK